MKKLLLVSCQKSDCMGLSDNSSSALLLFLQCLFIWGDDNKYDILVRDCILTITADRAHIYYIKTQWSVAMRDKSQHFLPQTQIYLLTQEHWKRLYYFYFNSSTFNLYEFTSVTSLLGPRLTRLLKKSYSSLNMINLSLLSECVSESFKVAVIKLIPKYKPLSNILFLSKILEKAVANQLCDSLFEVLRFLVNHST